MSEMAGRIETAGDSTLPHTQFEISEDAGHRFRSRMLDKCAIIEKWAVDILIESAKSAGDSASKKLPHLFGKRLDAVRGIAESARPVLKRPRTVIDLLAHIRPYADLRSALAHSVIQVAVDTKGSAIVIFTHTSKKSETGLPWRIVFTAEDMDRILRELAPIANQLKQQQCRNGISPASSPPRPKPAAAAGP